MPALPSWLILPLWDQFAVLLPSRPVFDPTHPLGCHRRRIPDRVVFGKLIQVLRFGCSYEAIADTACSASTIRNRRDEWITLGIFVQLKRIALDAYDRFVGLLLDQIAVDGCITKAPGGGECAGPSPVDRRKQGMKRSLMVEGAGIPLGRVLTGANRHDSPLLAPTLDKLDDLGPLPDDITVHLDSGYGAALTRFLCAHHVSVIEINQPDKAARRKRGKTDAGDAESAARAVLSGRATAFAKTSDGPVEMMRMFKLAKTSALKARTQAINQLKAVLVTTDPALRESLAGLSRWRLIRRCAELDTTDPQDAVTAAIYTMRLLGRRILRLGEEIRDLEQQITTAINACAPALLHRRGIGHDSAAALLLAAGDNPEQLNTEASFAALCGTSPIEASSGKTQRRRLNRGGDRQANAALYRIVLTRLRCDTSTHEYLQRRLTEGKTRREVIRSLKRYVAREVYPLLRPVRTTPEHRALTA